MSAPSPLVDRFPLVVITLMKGVTYREADPPLWQSLLDMQARVRDHLAFLGLELVIDEVEGYAYLRQRAAVEGEPELPRLIPRRPLTFQVSLLIALLRKKLVELDSGAAETRLILSRDQIAEMMRLFLPGGSNDAKLFDRIDAYVNKVEQLGFLRKLRGDSERYEVQRILKAFVDAQWLHSLDDRLAEYQAALAVPEAQT
jgi:hypothetical protein